MKKVLMQITLIFTIMIASMSWSLMTANANGDNISMNYENYTAPINKGQYTSNTWAVNANYFNRENPLSISLDGMDVYDYTVEIYRTEDPDTIVYTKTSDTTDNKVLIELEDDLLTGDYVFHLTVNDGMLTDEKNIEVGYYYYTELDVTASYRDNRKLRANTAAIKTPDFQSTGNLITNRIKLTKENELKYTLSNFSNFDSEKNYSYKVEYSFFENDVNRTGELIPLTSFVPQDTVEINVTDIKDLDKATTIYTTKIKIYDDETSQVVFEARVDYELYDFLLEDGTMMYHDGRKAAYTIDKEYYDSSTLLIDREIFESNKNVYLLATGEGLEENTNYYYSLEFKKEKDVVREINEGKTITGSELKKGIVFNSREIEKEEITSIVIKISKNPLNDSSKNPIKYTYYIDNFTIENPKYIVKAEKQYILVDLETSANDIEKSLKINHEDITSPKTIKFENLLNNTTAKTGSTVTIQEDGQNLITYTIVVIGDVNKDGKITMSDVVVLRKHIAQINFISEDIALEAANVNHDENITMSDVIILRKHIAGIESITD